MKRICLLCFILGGLLSFSTKSMAQKASTETEEVSSVSDTIRTTPHSSSSYQWGRWTPDIYGYPFWNTWNYTPLHNGLNISAGMDVSVGFGKYAPKGAGFGQTISLTYVQPLNKRLSLLVGIDARHQKWGGYNYTSVGLTASLAYKVNERFNLYAYAYKRLTPRPPVDDYNSYMWGDGFIKERFGFAADYKLSNKVSLGLSVDVVNRDGFNPYAQPDYSLLRPYNGLYW